MAARIVSYRPSAAVVAGHLAVLREPVDGYRKEWSAWVLVGLDDAEVDRELAAWVGGQPADTTTAALTSALARHGLGRIFAADGEVANLRALAWFEPPAGHGAELVARLARLRARAPGPASLLTAVLVDAVTRFAPGELAVLADLHPASWVEHAARATALGQPFHCKWAASPSPDWLPAGHPVELRDPLTATLRRQVLAGDGWQGPYLASALAGRNPGVGLVYLDVDNMKRLLDYHGMRAGDLALRALADRLQALIGDRVVRFGGDEFLVIWEGTDVAELGRRLVADQGSVTVVEPDAPEVRIALSVSAGSVIDDDLARGLRRAEDAVQAAKQAGRGRAQHAA